MTKKGPDDVMTHIEGCVDGTLLTGLSYWVSQQAPAIGLP